MAEYSREQRNQLSRAIANSETGSRQLKRFVDNRYSSVKYMQKKQTVIQRGVPEAKAIWVNIPHPESIPLLTFERVISNADPKLIEAWNFGRNSEIDPYFIKPRDTVDKFINNRTEWMKKPPHTPLECEIKKRMPLTFPISHEVAYIGRDHPKKENGNSLLMNSEIYRTKNKAVPLTLVSYLRDINKDYSKELNTQFIDMIISAKIPVVFTAEVDLNYCQEQIPNRISLVGNTSEEVIYLLQHGYTVSNDKLIPPS